jgi:hypothetical protein
MKKIGFLIVALLVPLISFVAQETSASKAREILGKRFIGCEEITQLYPEIPINLKIPFSEKTLLSSRESWLIPLLSNGQYKYYFVQANFDNEVTTPGFLQNKDTLRLNEAKMAIKLLSELRPQFLRSAENLKYFFRTKTVTTDPKGIGFRKIVAYSNNKFLVVDFPNYAELGIINKKYISYLARNKRGVEVQLGLAFLPENELSIPEKESIFVLTMFYRKI